MTYQEILDEINGHTKTVRVLEEPHQGHVSLRVAYYTNENENTILDEAFNLIVPTLDDPLQPFGDKEAYYERRKPPYLASDPQFKADLLARIAEIQVAQPELKFYDIKSINNQEEKAILAAYWLEAGKLVQKGYGAYRKADNSIDFLEIVGNWIV
jgi:hypothetical protein